ncbi:MAG: hypothetical protein R6U20_08115 [Longimonas sp.]|uniref:hypothetical protein n=1 Tax=Longimonas sp. TaxID=2039626 RepID=UPI0039752F6F
MSDSSYDSSQFNVERATNGLVLTLYLGAAIFLIVIVWMVMRTMPSSEEPSSEDESRSARTEVYVSEAQARPAPLSVPNAVPLVGSS